MKDSFRQDVFIHLITKKRFTDDNVFSLTMTLGYHAERWKHFVLICICIAHVICQWETAQGLYHIMHGFCTQNFSRAVPLDQNFSVW